MDDDKHFEPGGGTCYSIAPNRNFAPAHFQYIFYTKYSGSLTSKLGNENDTVFLVACSNAAVAFQFADYWRFQRGTAQFCYLDVAVKLPTSLVN